MVSLTEPGESLGARPTSGRGPMPLSFLVHGGKTRAAGLLGGHTDRSSHPREQVDVPRNDVDVHANGRVRTVRTV
eukprot:gene18884-biopygen19000